MELQGCSSVAFTSHIPAPRALQLATCSQHLCLRVCELRSCAIHNLVAFAVLIVLGRVVVLIRALRWFLGTCSVFSTTRNTVFVAFSQKLRPVAYSELCGEVRLCGGATCITVHIGRVQPRLGLENEQTLLCCQADPGPDTFTLLHAASDLLCRAIGLAHSTALYITRQV